MGRWLRRRRADTTRAGDDHLRHAEDREFLRALERLRTMTARELMTPRVDIVALALPVEAADVGQAVKQSGHSRFPVYEDDLDHLAGVLFVKDLFRMGDSEPTAEAIARRLRKPYLVPESRPALTLLQEMRAGRRAFAVIVDEYGGVEGVLTVKDLVGEIVGTLADEFDPIEEAEFVRIDAHRWLVGGQVGVDRVVAELGAPVPEGEWVTLGGFLFAAFGRIPDDGDEVERDGWSYRVAEMDRRRIAKVVVRAPDPGASGNVVPSPEQHEGAHGK